MNSLNDYDKEQIKQAINTACQYYGPSGQSISTWQLKDLLKKKLNNIQGMQYHNINDGDLLLNIGVTAVLIRTALIVLDKVELGL